MPEHQEPHHTEHDGEHNEEHDHEQEHRQGPEEHIPEDIPLSPPGGEQPEGKAIFNLLTDFVHCTLKHNNQ